mgnify:CR=1 FL=1
MRIIIRTFIFIIIGIQFAWAAPTVKISQGKILGLWAFLNSISNGQRASEIINNIYINSSFNNKNNQQQIKRLIDIRDLHFNQRYSFRDYPKKRGEMSWDVDQFFTLQAAKSKSVDDFFGRTTQILPPFEHRELFKIIKNFESVYLKLIWTPSKGKLKKYQEKLEAISKKSNLPNLFGKAIKFYNSHWPDSLPINVVVYPIPGKKGRTSATMVSDTAPLEVLLDEKDIVGRFGVVFHEISHGIYESQPKSFQKMINDFFKDSKSKFSNFTYSILNEGLATAIGNGWAYEKISGSVDKSDWYAKQDINLFAKGIYPEVKSYLKNNKSIDKEFLKYCIKKYEEIFPKAHFSYYNLLGNVWLGTDSNFDAGEAGFQLRNYFRVGGMQRSSPIEHKFTIRSFERSQKSDNAVIVVFKDKKEFKWFSEKVDALKPYSKKIMEFKKSGLFTFFDKRKKPFLIFKVNNFDEFRTILKRLQKIQFMKESSNYISISDQ